MQKKLIYKRLSYKINGGLFKVHNLLGRFRSEKSYADAFESWLKKVKIKYTREIAIEPSFEGEARRRNIPDFIIENKIVIDFKAKKFITKEDYNQMQRYLNSSNLTLGMVVNFRNTYLKPKRVINYKN